MSTKGIDISYSNLITDYARAKANGVKFAIIRSSYGTDMDSKFLSHVNGCRAAGIQITGIYVFCYALSVADAIKEAEVAVNLAKQAKLGKKDIVIWYDLEYDSVRYAREMGITLDKLKCIEWTRAFCNRVEELGYSTGIYANLDYYRNMYDSAIFKRYQCWLAHYTSGAPAYDCTYQQYASDGRVAGINENVDMDYCLVPLATTKQTTKPVKTAKKSINIIAKEVIAGKWGTGADRKKKLTKAGYSYSKVQAEVNKILSQTSKDDLTVFVEGVQKACGAKVDGIPGDETLSKVPTVSTATNRTHLVVNPILKYLKALGYYSGDIDGIFGVGAKSATMAYQREHGCIADGEITAGCATWRKLLGM